MKNGILIFLSVVGIIIAIFFLSLFIVFKEEDRYLGDFSGDCVDNFKVSIYHYSEFDWIQPVSFQLSKDDSVLVRRTVFAGTNNRRERIESFSLHCQDSIFYITFKNEEEILMIYDKRTKLIFPKPAGSEKEYDEWLFRDSLISILKQGI